MLRWVSEFYQYPIKNCKYPISLTVKGKDPIPQKKKSVSLHSLAQCIYKRNKTLVYYTKKAMVSHMINHTEHLSFKFIEQVERRLARDLYTCVLKPNHE